MLAIQKSLCSSALPSLSELLKVEVQNKAMEIGSVIRNQKDSCDKAIDFIERRFPAHLLELPANSDHFDDDGKEWWKRHPYMYEWEKYSSNAWRMPRAMSSINSLKDLGRGVGKGVGRLLRRLGSTASLGDRPSRTPSPGLVPCGASKAVFAMRGIEDDDACYFDCIPHRANSPKIIENASYDWCPPGHTQFSFWVPLRARQRPPMGHTAFSWERRPQALSQLL